MKKFLSIAKITRPTLPKVFPRERLFKMLEEGRERSVIWISGPAGSGKTTLVAGYIESRRIPCLWYQIDEGDSDVATFFYYLGLAGKKAPPRARPWARLGLVLLILLIPTGIVLLLAYSVILRNIRERQALEAATHCQAAELERAYAQLRDLDRAKSHFLNLVSHELRSPLASIGLTIDLLRRKGTSMALDEPVDILDRSVGQMEHLIQDLLDVVRLEAGRLAVGWRSRMGPR